MSPSATSNFASPLVLEGTQFSSKYGSLSGWPTVIKNTLAWKGSDFSVDQYGYHLSKSDRLEISDALAHFKGLGLFGDKVIQNTFPLPNLGPKLRDIALDIHTGKGFHSIHGLNVKDYTQEDNIILFLGISSYIGSKRGLQNADGHIFTHIMNSPISDSIEPQCTRPLMFSRKKGAFHTDHRCDILALQNRTGAKKGGRQMIASSAWVYNKMASLHPDLLEELANPNWPVLETSRDGDFGTVDRPLLFHKNGKIILNFVRQALTKADGLLEIKGQKDLSAKQFQALNMVQSLAQESELILTNSPGTMTFINNYAIMHSREAFEDDETAPRYVVRMFLKNPQLQWQLPSELQIGNAAVYDYAEGEESWNVAAVPKMVYHITDRGVY